jgi:hypothetical protein
MHVIGGRTVNKVRNHDLGVVARLSPDIVILEIGTNDLSLLPPEVVGSEIEELVSLLQQTYHIKVVCVCLVTPQGFLGFYHYCGFVYFRIQPVISYDLPCSYCRRYY